MKRTTLLMIAALISIQAAAQTGDYALEIQAGKKFLNTEKLGLAPTTKLSELLEIFPELLAREGESRLDNYDLQLDDVSTGGSKNIILEQLTLSEIKNIEVSSNPSAGQQKNSQGGVINVHLRNLDEGFSGKAILDAGSLAIVMPSVQLNYRKGAWAIRGSLMMEYYHPRNENAIRETHTSSAYTYSRDSSLVDYGYEMASVDALFSPDSQNKLHLWAWESLALDSELKKQDVEVNSVNKYESSLYKERMLSYLLGANYNHLFNKSEVEAECTFESTPNSPEYDKYSGWARQASGFLHYSGKNVESKLAGLAKYRYNFVPDTPRRKSNLTGGINIILNSSSTSYDYQQYTSKMGLSGESARFCLSPYIETNHVFDRWFIKASVRYNHYSSDIKTDSGKQFSRQEDYFTWFLSAGYQIAPHHHLSIIVDKSAVDASAQQLYPYKLYDPTQEYFTSGNPMLLPMKTFSASANYITDFKAGDNVFTLDAELKYMNNTDIISSEKRPEVITYNNDGYSNIGAANLLLGFSRKFFSISLTTNVFDNFTHISGVNDHYLYYNISLIPSLNFSEGWVISARFTYNSHVYTKTSRMSDYLFAQTRFSKTWNKLTAYLELRDNFHESAEDEFYGKGISESLWYNLHRPSLGLGFHLAF